MASIIVPDNYSPIKVGDTLYPWSPQFVTYDSSGRPAALNLTGLTLSMTMKNGGGDVKICANAWVVDDAAGGLAHYPWNASDVDTAGIWELSVQLRNSGGQVAHALTKTLEIEKP